MAHWESQQLQCLPETGNHSYRTVVFQTHTQEGDPCMAQVAAGLSRTALSHFAS